MPTRQRAELTYKQNSSHGRHGWLRLTPAYSVQLVDQILGEFGNGASSVFDPFLGTGTTPLCAAYRGMRAAATDINPFLIWLGRVKTSQYTEAHHSALKAAGESICIRILNEKARQAPLPPLKNIERWWGPSELAFIAALRGEIEYIADLKVRDLLKVVFCRTMIALSNAAFNHQSMSFKDNDDSKQMTLGLPKVRNEFLARFRGDLLVVVDSILDNPRSDVSIEMADARGLVPRLEVHDPFDLIITSPPYPNRMSYIRELRPYMYWLGYLAEAREAGELDWEAIGGTWGIATSRLLTWTATDAFIPPYLSSIVGEIRKGNEKNGPLMAQYVLKYFDDMFHHFLAASKMLRHGGTAHYIVGNSTFYGNLVPSERLYVDQLLKCGFRTCEARPIRKRNSKQELIEYHIIAQK